MNRYWRPSRAVAALVLTLPLASGAAAQAWPAKPVRVVIAFAPGGGTDIMGRLLSRKFTEAMGQSFVPENRAGAGGLLAAELVAKSPPDGYVIMVSTASLSVNVNLHRKLAFDPVKDLAPVSWLASVPLMLVVHPSVPVRSAKELVALAKKRPGQLNAGSNGTGTTSHLAIEMLNQSAGIKVTHIPYKGGGPAQIALIAGEVDFRFSSVISGIVHIRTGRMRPLAVTTAKRSFLLPELPPLSSFYPGTECDQWYAMFLPAGTPKEIVSKLHAETVKALTAPDVKEFMAKETARKRSAARPRNSLHSSRRKWPSTRRSSPPRTCGRIKHPIPEKPRHRGHKGKFSSHLRPSSLVTRHSSLITRPPGTQ